MGSVRERLLFEEGTDVMSTAVMVVFFFCIGLVLIAELIGLPAIVYAAVPATATARISPNPVNATQNLIGWCNAL